MVSLYRSDPLRKQVYDYLREMLISGHMKAGDYINQAELMQQLGVSRTPLRDSLIQLEAEGFVFIIPCKGVLIRSLAREDIRHIYRISGALESAVFEDVFDRVGKEQTDQLEVIVDNTQERIDRGDFSTCHDNNILFHERILVLSDNEALLKILRCSRERLYYFPNMNNPTLDMEDFVCWEKEYWQQHREIIRIFRKGTPREVADYIRDVHWDFEGVEEHIANFYQLS